jgi:glycosyltransferase involved in cell wall biosynthesis
VPRSLRRVVVDLRHLEATGGGRIVTLGLLDAMADVAPDTEFVLLTAAATHQPTPGERPNLISHCAWPGEDSLRLGERARRALRGSVRRLLPARSSVALRGRYWARASRRLAHQPMVADADVVFSPLGSTALAGATAPFVAIVHDLQHVLYPEFFSEEQRQLRLQQLDLLVERADRLVCVSEFVRQSMLRSTAARPEQLAVIYHTTFQELPTPSPASSAETLNALALTDARFVLYPANFWPHKNHARLLEAMAAFNAAGAPLHLVCTGAPDAAMAGLTQTAANLGGSTWAHFPGYVDREALAALYAHCWALLYPSLSEGFGLPLLEAMRFGRPILCSQTTSCAEVAGDAALLFDPTRPEEIRATLEQLDRNPALAETLARRGRQRRKRFGTPADVARHYLDLFDRTLAERRSPPVAPRP